MKICVLIKQVASEDSNLVLSSDKLSLNADALNLISIEQDTYALEEALQLKEKTEGSVKVCTFGPESSRQVIKDALAKGADRGIYISNNEILNESKTQMKQDPINQLKNIEQEEKIITKPDVKNKIENNQIKSFKELIEISDEKREL